MDGSCTDKAQSGIGRTMSAPCQRHGGGLLSSLCRDSPWRFPAGEVMQREPESNQRSDSLKKM